MKGFTNERYVHYLVDSVKKVKRRMTLLKIFLIVFCVKYSQCQEVEGASNIWPELLNIQGLNSNVSQILSNVTLNDLQAIFNAYLQPSAEIWSISELCKEQLQMLSKGITNMEKWALMMLDASAKLQSGLLYGNVLHFGNYEECIDVNYAYAGGKYKTHEKLIKGQYCTAALSIGVTDNNFIQEVDELDLLSIRMTFGMCVPSGCSARDIQNISNSVLQKYLPGGKLIYMDKFCSRKDTPKDIPTRTVIGLIIFSIFGLVIGLATFADIYNLKGNHAVLQCFSFYSNGKKLVNAKSNENSLKCLNGLRVISMMFILLGHRFIVASGVPAVNKIFVEDWKNYWYNYIYIGLGFCVDTFFTISGLLVVYLYIRKTESASNFPWRLFYLHRILRLTPSLLMVVLFYSTMLIFIEHEPFNVIDSNFGALCREHWWSTVLYVQNYWNPNSMCAVHTWYLAIDTQLYILSPLLLIPLKKFPSVTLLGTFLLIILSMAAALEVTWQKSLGATYLNQGPEEYKYLYTPTHIRVPPWLLGAITGYVIAKNKKRSFPMNTVIVYLLWIISLSSLLFVLLIQKAYHKSEYNVLDSALYNTFARPVWGAAICIIIWLCETGNGRLINSFLSCSVFNVLIRINYAVYLVHMMVSMAVLATIKTPMYLSDFSTIHAALGDYGLVLVVATIWTLAFESPIIALEKLFFSRGDWGKEKYVVHKKSPKNDVKGSCETVVIS